MCTDDAQSVLDAVWSAVRSRKNVTWQRTCTAFAGTAGHFGGQWTRRPSRRRTQCCTAAVVNVDPASTPHGSSVVSATQQLRPPRACRPVSAKAAGLQAPRHGAMVLTRLHTTHWLAETRRQLAATVLSMRR